MQTYPFLKRWLAAGLSAAVFVVLVVVITWSGRPGSGLESVADAQLSYTDSDWPMFGGGPTRNMVNLKAKGLAVDWDNDEKKPENILWSANLGSRAYGGPTVADGKVFVGTNNQKPRNLRNRTVKLPGDKDEVLKIRDTVVNNDIEKIKDVFAKLPEMKEIECTYKNAEGKEKEGKLAVIPIDLGVLMVFNQKDGKFLYETTFLKLKSGQVCDWPLEGLCSTPTVEGNRMYYTSNRCEMICADTKDGKIIWKLDMIGQLGVFPHNLTASCPLIVGDDVYIVTANGVDEGHINVPSPKAPSFLKLNKNTGKILWQDNSPSIQLAEAGKADPNKQNAAFMKTLVDRGELIQHGQWSNPAYAVVDGQKQIVWPGGNGVIYSFDPDGKPLWTFDCNPKDAKYQLGPNGTRSDFIATPVIYKNRVYIGTGQDPEHEQGVAHLWCIDMTKRGDVSPELVTDYSVWPPKTKPNPNSAKVWHYGGLAEAKGKEKLDRKFKFGRTMSTCAIHDDLLYVSEWEGYFHCIDANTGAPLWQHATKSYNWTSPYWADNKIYIGGDAGTVFVFEHGKKKNLLGENDMNKPVRASPVAVGNVLYVIAGNKLYAIQKK